MKKLVAILSGLVLFLLVLYLAVFMGLSRGWALLGLALLLLLVYLLVPRARVQAVRILNSWIWFWVGLLALAGLLPAHPDTVSIPRLSARGAGCLEELHGFLPAPACTDDRGHAAVSGDAAGGLRPTACNLETS